MTRFLPVAMLAAGLCACSGGAGVSAAAPTATVTVTASTTPSAVPSSSPPVSPSALPSSSPSPSASVTDTASDPAQATPSTSPSVPGGRGVDATVHGQLALRGVDAITVTPGSDQEVKALLLPFTEVNDAKGLVCSDGKAPRSCSMEQLQEVLQKDAVIFAEVTIKDGVAVRIDKITKE